ncbi:hypothetical protein MLD38_002861 [Melastoma candidum]|uniref:Uncharacterized protein n=1 Tax=Melastoma candidum TaxID=119954 RepID=A0ACB9RZZ0_9MYRT|nr:hypothetical protein MLD38_002861 [Melastoma candidum]
MKASLSFLAACLAALFLVGAAWEEGEASTRRGKQLLDKPCEEIYVVREGETLHTIGDKCGDPFIIERNPHVQDPDDVFPGLVLEIVPRNSNSARKFLMR